VTEGYLDVIACHQFGMENVVGVLGVALTKEHAKLLGRLCNRIVLLFDGDEAGLRAANSATEVLFDLDVDVGIATLKEWTDAKDPDELVRRRGGVETLKRAIDGATDLLRFRLRGLAERTAELGPGALHAAIVKELTTLHGLGLDNVVPSKRHVVMTALAEAIQDECGPGFEPRALRSVMADVRRTAARRAAARGEAGGAAPAGSPRVTSREHLLGCLLNDPALWMTLAPEDRELLDPSRFEHEGTRRVAEVIAEEAGPAGAPPLTAILDLLEAEQAAAAVSLARRVELETEGERDRLHEHWRQTLANIRQSLGAQEEITDDHGIAERLERLRSASTSHGDVSERGGRAVPDAGLNNTVLPGIARRG